MRYSLSGKPVPAHYPFAEVFNEKCSEINFPPCVAYAIGWRETLCFLPPDVAERMESFDGGRGIMQLTASYPVRWNEADVNVAYALATFLVPIFEELRGRALAGDGILRVGAASYNAGLETAWRAHLRGNVDAVTTNRYAAAVAANYARLVNGEPL